MAIKKENEVRENVIDIAIPEIEKTQFRINGDNDKIIELNISDMNILTRLSDVYSKLKTLETDFAEVSKMDPEDIEALGGKLKEIDGKMREYVDYIFDYPVSEPCAGNGSMYDPVNGKLRYEHIIEALSKLYEANITKEMEAIQKRVEKHTKKYKK